MTYFSLFDNLEVGPESYETPCVYEEKFLENGIECYICFLESLDILNNSYKKKKKNSKIPPLPFFSIFSQYKSAV